MVNLSSNLLYTAFVLYFVALIFFGGAIREKRSQDNNRLNRWGKLGISVTIIGFLAQLGYFITRWIASGHAPVSNLFEFTTFFGMALIGAFIAIFFIYKTPLLGLFTLPIGILIIAFASMFNKNITPLIPSLQSHWLQIHVITAALGQAILAISFAAGIIYLVKHVNQMKRSKSTFWLEIVMFGLICTIGFITVTSSFSAADYKANFNWIDKGGAEAEVEYTMPALVGPHEGELVKTGKFEPLLEMPAIIDAKKLNTVLWSIIAGLLLYGLIRLITRKRIGELLKPLVKNINSDLVDEISYRSVLIGFPVFTLGALIFAMIWAQIAWTRFWGWDPKEVWALVTWLFYAAFLHLRLSKGWHGEKSAWLAVIGFVIMMFNLVVVNLVIVGLHSYAG